MYLEASFFVVVEINKKKKKKRGKVQVFWKRGDGISFLSEFFQSLIYCCWFLRRYQPQKMYLPLRMKSLKHL